jgi:hypothetical protein
MPSRTRRSGIHIRGTFVGCCASALAPHTVNATTVAKSPTHSRFLILDFRLSEQAITDRSDVLSRICFFPQSKIQNRKSKII